MHDHTVFFRLLTDSHRQEYSRPLDFNRRRDGCRPLHGVCQKPPLVGVWIKEERLVDTGGEIDHPSLSETGSDDRGMGLIVGRRFIEPVGRQDFSSSARLHLGRSADHGQRSFGRGRTIAPRPRSRLFRPDQLIRDDRMVRFKIEIQVFDARRDRVRLYKLRLEQIGQREIGNSLVVGSGQRRFHCRDQAAAVHHEPSHNLSRPIGKTRHVRQHEHPNALHVRVFEIVFRQDAHRPVRLENGFERPERVPKYCGSAAFANSVRLFRSQRRHTRPALTRHNTPRGS